MSNLLEYVKQLDCPDEAERGYAAEDIGYLNSPEGVAPLVKHLGKETSRAVRDAIFQSLTRIDSDAAIQGAIGLLQDDDPQIRNQAVDVLRAKGAAAIPFLEEVMRGDDKDLRKLVLDVVKGSRAAGASTIYEAALCDPDPNVSMTAVENIGKIRATVFRRRVEALFQANAHPMLTSACLGALAEMGDELSLAAIRRRYSDLATLPDFVLVPCLQAIGNLGRADAFAEVAGLLAVRGAHIRPAILGALVALHTRHAGEVHDDDLLQALRKVVEEQGPALCRYEAVRALGFLGSRDDVYRFVAECLSDAERMVRLGAIESLREMKRPELASLLAARAALETDSDVVEALGV